MPDCCGYAKCMHQIPSLYKPVVCITQKLNNLSKLTLFPLSKKVEDILRIISSLTTQLSALLFFSHGGKRNTRRQVSGETSCDTRNTDKPLALSVITGRVKSSKN